MDRKVSKGTKTKQIRNGGVCEIVSKLFQWDKILNKFTMTLANRNLLRVRTEHILLASAHRIVGYAPATAPDEEKESEWGVSWSFSCSSVKTTAVVRIRGELATDKCKHIRCGFLATALYTAKKYRDANITGLGRLRNCGALNLWWTRIFPLFHLVWANNNKRKARFVPGKFVGRKGCTIYSCKHWCSLSLPHDRRLPTHLRIPSHSIGILLA